MKSKKRGASTVATLWAVLQAPLEIPKEFRKEIALKLSYPQKHVGVVGNAPASHSTLQYKFHCQHISTVLPSKGW